MVMGLNDQKSTFFVIFIAILGLQIFALFKGPYLFPGLENRVWPFLLISFLLLIIAYFSDPRLLRRTAALMKRKPRKIKIKKRKNINLAKKSNMKLPKIKFPKFKFFRKILYLFLLLSKKIDNFLKKVFLLFLLQIRKLNDFKVIVNFLFQLFLVFYLILLLINEFVAIEFINLNYILVLTIIFGVLTVIFPVKKEVKEKPMKTFDKIIVYVLAVIGMVLIFIKTKDLGWLSYVISIISGVLIVLLGNITYHPDLDDN